MQILLLIGLLPLVSGFGFLSTEPTIFHYPKSERKRDLSNILYPTTSPRSYQIQPSYSPPSRTIYNTPPLPPEYMNPFAGKPTLRGTNSENNHSPSRRPLPPVHRPDSKDRVPIPPPDLIVPEQKPSGKKALNTPSRPNYHAPFETVLNNNLKQEMPISRHVNETDFEILQYPAVSRILSGSSGRKNEYSEYPKLYENFNPVVPVKKEVVTVAPPPPPPPKKEDDNVASAPIPVPDVVLNKTEPIIPIVKIDGIKRLDNESYDEPPPAAAAPTTTDEILPQESERHVPPERDHYLWKIAWDVHVYVIASLFTLLAVSAVYNLALIPFSKYLFAKAYFVSVQLELAAIGVLRSVYLFHDAYNLSRSYPEPISHLLLNLPCPLITTAFAVVFLFLVKTTELSGPPRMLRHPVTVIFFGLFHLALCVCLDMTSDLYVDANGRRFLPMVCQGVYVALCLLLCGGFLMAYKGLSEAATRKQIELYGTVYTTDVHRTRPAALSLAIRICLAISMLILLLCLILIYGLIGVPDSPAADDTTNNERWLWWAYQSSVRIIEVAVCYLLAWAAMQRLANDDEKETNSQNSTTGFALFPCAGGGPCRVQDEHVEDIYPAVCSANQAIHQYSLRTGKKVYDDAFPLNTMEKHRPNGGGTWNKYDEIGPGSEVVEIKDALTRKGLNSLTRSDSERSSLPPTVRKSGTLPPGERRRNMSGVLSRDTATLRATPPSRGNSTEPPSSMLVDENGFVRFRSLAAEDARRSANYYQNKSLPRRPIPVEPR